MILSQKIRFPRDFHEGAKSIIKHLTEHDLSRRYGCLKNGTLDIKRHRFFKDLNFDLLLRKKLTPPTIQPSGSAKKTQGGPIYSVDTLPENRDPRSPELRGSQDPFSKWFDSW